MTPPSNVDPFDFSEFANQATSLTPNGSPHRGLVVDTNQERAQTNRSFDPFAEQSPGHGTSMSPREGSSASPETGSSSAIAVTQPPLPVLYLAFAAAAFGVIVGTEALARSATMPAFVGWLLAGPAAIGLLARFAFVDTRRRIGSVYTAPPWLRSAYWAVIATSGVGIACGAAQMALWAGRL